MAALRSTDERCNMVMLPRRAMMFGPSSFYLGTLWTWGYNNRGQLGLGNITSYSSPKQVGALTTWLAVAAGDFHTIARSS